MSKIKLHYYHIWNSSHVGGYDTYPVVCSMKIDGWDGTVKGQVGHVNWKYEEMTEEDINYVISNLGLYSAKYGFTCKIYSMDTAMWYDDIDKLKEDLYTQAFAGV